MTVRRTGWRKFRLAFMVRDACSRGLGALWRRETLCKRRRHVAVKAGETAAKLRPVRTPIRDTLSPARRLVTLNQGRQASHFWRNEYRHS
jgi:hypothetical protein